MNEKRTEKNIADFLDSFVGSIKSEHIELYKRIVQDSQIKKIKDYEEFFYAIIYPFNNFIEGFVKTEIANNDDVAFLYSNSEFVENNFKKMIIKYEGSVFCADKTRTIMNCLIDYYTTGVEIIFNHNDEYTYHLPKKIFFTHEDILEFYKSLKALFFGSPMKYLKQLSKLTREENNE